MPLCDLFMGPREPDGPQQQKPVQEQLGIWNWHLETNPTSFLCGIFSRSCCHRVFVLSSKQIQTSCAAQEQPSNNSRRGYPRSFGESHSKFVRLGIQNSELEKIRSVTAVQNDPASNLVCAVFGPWASKAIATGTNQSQMLGAKFVDFCLAMLLQK